MVIAVAVLLSLVKISLNKNFTIMYFFKIERDKPDGT